MICRITDRKMDQSEGVGHVESTPPPSSPSLLPVNLMPRIKQGPSPPPPCGPAGTGREYDIPAAQATDTTYGCVGEVYPLPGCSVDFAEALQLPNYVVFDG